jgi:hypothetical protein
VTGRKIKIKPKYIKREIDPKTGDNYYYLTLKIKTNNVKMEIINSMLAKELLEPIKEEKLDSDIFGRPDNFEAFFKGFAKREKK